MIDFIVHSEERKPVHARDGQECFEFDTGYIFVHARGTWKPLARPVVMGNILRKSLTANAAPVWVPFPTKCASDNPAFIFQGWTLDEGGNKKGKIDVYITGLNRSGFNAQVLDEDCMLEFTYGDALII